MKKALIIGVLSQDGRFMSRFLWDKGYEVYGTLREGDFRITEVVSRFPQMRVFPTNIENTSALEDIIKLIEPDEIYNFSGLSSVAKSFEMPLEYDLVNHTAVRDLLRVIEKIDARKEIRFFQSGSSEMFGNSDLLEVDELSPMSPSSPYGESKLNAYRAVREFRQHSGLFLVNGILFNHESEYRKPDFLSRKLIHSLVTYKYLGARQIELGNVSASRDWSYVGDFIPGIWKSLQLEKASDFILASGVQHTILQMLDVTCSVLNIDFNFERDLRIDRNLYRSSESVPVKAITDKAKRELGWKSLYNLEKMISVLIHFETSRVISGIEPPIFPEKTI